MGIALVWIIAKNIIIAVATVLSFSNFYVLLKFFKATIPITNGLIEAGAMKPNTKKQLLIVDFVSSFLMLLFSAAVVLVCVIFTMPSGLYVFLVAIVIAVLFFRPSQDMYTESYNTLVSFAKYHSVVIDKKIFTEVTGLHLWPEEEE